MTACTERHPAALTGGLAGEGQKVMPKRFGMILLVAFRNLSGA